ncbi:flagellar hook protein FlgE [Kineosphaera limosa]|uniref:Putative flagellar hook protein FlgE n=1 Tax=Kineosphaera limosa NBRC 100340 TaxID=1184609 RepID=K6WWX9_9MICO|nr:flagellar hook-basal body protein [Kineosphaera limosa]NYD99815.1 flagellar hook protein FlgE [Kineosphaera limosa]GAB98296.1 putative flagellar hook protein FlgE [Kineosphaera limosa NBRC 100340]
MFRSYDVAVSGLRSHQNYIDVTSNNIANVNSDGFKASRALFEDTLTALARGVNMQPRPQPNGAINAAMIGLGVRTAGVEGDFSQGAFKITNIATDMGIEGEGYFVLRGNDGPVYTRNGNFTFDANGTLRAGDGKPVLGTNNQPITAPAGRGQASHLSIGQGGQVALLNPAGPATILGTIQMARFNNNAGLERVGNSEFAQTVASGAPITGVGGQNGIGRLISGVTEASNVDMGAEFTNLIMAQRGLTASSRVMTTTDELVDRINQMK